MTQALQAPPPTSLCRTQVLSSDLSVLTHIYDDDVNLAVWQRTLSEPVERYTQWLLAQPMGFAWQEVIRSTDGANLAAQKLPDHSQRHDFIDDFAEVLEVFCCLFELEAVGVRLRVLDRATCPRFHTDRVPCRLITTYGGAGTEWLSNPEDCPLPQAPPPTALNAVQVMSGGEVALLKGDSWKGNEGLGLVHRSPQVIAPHKRLLLTLDFG